MAEETAIPAVEPAPPATPAAEAAPPPVADPAQTHMVKEYKHTRPLFSCRVDRAGKFAFAGAHDYLVQRFEIASDQRAELTGHQSWVRGMTVLPAAEMLASVDYAGRLHAWRYAGDPAAALAYGVEAHQGWARAVAASPDGAVLATAGNDRLVKLWNAADGTPIRELAGHESHVYNVVFHPSGQALASADLKGVVKHWDLASGAATRQFDAAALWKFDPTFKADIGGARGMAFSPDGKLLACSGITDVSNAFAGIGNPLVVVIDWETGEKKQLLRPKEPFQGVAWGVAFHPAGFVMAVGGGGGGGALWFWNPDNPEPIFELKLPSPARDLDLFADGLRLAIAHADGLLRIYQMTPKPA